MRKVKLQMQMSLNGYVAGPNGELDWMTWDWDEELSAYTGRLTDSSDTILMGRKMVDGFCAHWEGVAADPENPEQESGKQFVEMPKLVFSTTVEELEWQNVTVAKMEAREEIARLKQQEGKDLIVYGGAGFVSHLVKEGLIDEYYLFVNPVTIQDGLRIFDGVERLDLKLVEVKAFDCGIVVLHYQAERNQ